MERSIRGDEKLLLTAEALERLWQSADFQVWRVFIDNRINQLRDDVELFGGKMSDLELRIALSKLEVLRTWFVDLFVQWKDTMKAINRDGELNSSDGPMV